MELLLGIFSAFGLSASAGLNAYIPLFIVGALGHYTNFIHLHEPWNALTNPWILILLGILIIIEFLADKVPAINHLNDVIQTLIRPAAGAIVFAASAHVVTDIHPLLALACGLIIAGGVHVAKSALIRPAVTVLSGGVGNAPVSLAEDIIATVLSLLAIIIPILAGALLIVLISFFIWWLWRRSNKNAV